MRTQQGATLVIALIILAIITLLVVSSLGTTSMNLKVVGNMQSRSEALHAAQQAIETVISTPRFMATPADAVLEPCGKINTYCTDLDGDGSPEYITRLNPAPSCVAAKVIKESELNLSRADDAGCATDRTQQVGVASGDSLCADSTWEITAETSSTVSRTKVTVTQGVAVRISASDAKALCGVSDSGAPQGGGNQRPKEARLFVDAKEVRPVITQKRVRTYWYTHGDW